MNTTAPTFFSVDVETTHTSPTRGSVLTVGIQVVDTQDDRWDKYHMTSQTLYCRIDRTDYYPTWFRTLTDPDSTLSWWLKQNDEAQAEAFRDVTLERMKPGDAADIITDFVVRNQPDPKRRVFVANPVSFDKPWVDTLFEEVEMLDAYPARNPFPHRTLCLRSMRFGLQAGNGWGPERVNHDPVIPHHALSDAIAQARDLIAMLTERESR